MRMKSMQMIFDTAARCLVECRCAALSPPQAEGWLASHGRTNRPFHGYTVGATGAEVTFLKGRDTKTDQAGIRTLPRMPLHQPQKSRITASKQYQGSRGDLEFGTGLGECVGGG